MMRKVAPDETESIVGDQRIVVEVCVIKHVGHFYVTRFYGLEGEDGMVD